jgi:hypothetical protein
MAGPDDDKPENDSGGEVVPIEEARKRHDAEVAAASPSPAGETGAPPPADGTPPTPAFLQPVMAAIARELADLAGSDGVVRLGGEDEASRAKTAAVVRGIGAGLGAALADAFGKWAEKLQHPPGEPPATPPPDDKKPST